MFIFVVATNWEMSCRLLTRHGYTNKTVSKPCHPSKNLFILYKGTRPLSNAHRGAHLRQSDNGTTLIIRMHHISMVGQTDPSSMTHKCQNENVRVQPQ